MNRSPTSKKRKYNNEKLTIEFHGNKYKFDSMAEANYFMFLAKRLEKGEIDRLKLQPSYTLTSPFIIATDKTKSGKSRVPHLRYSPDFEYYEKGKKIAVEVKGMKTTSYQMRLKLFLACAYEKHKVDTFIEVTSKQSTQYECSSVREVK